ncbi:cytochrome P450 [Mycolicibacter senuensis]|nr:cytochrome P450 [Mycolicibacter senuensis]
MDAQQDSSRPVCRIQEGTDYWMFTDYAVILDGLQQPEKWSSSVVVPTEPDPPYKWIPIMLDPPEHTKWRHVLGSYFSPGRVTAMLDDQRRLAGELIDALVPKGGCDFVTDIAQVFPATVFLNIMGMPLTKLDEFLGWEDMILHTDEVGEAANATRFAGMLKVQEYFSGLIAERRANPDPDAQDIVSNAVEWTIDGAPATDLEILNCLLLLFMAGLDTVTSQVSYAMLHLATHPADRARLVAEPALTAHAIEELLRAYPIVQTARKATRDMDFHGCPVKTGDMALFPLAAAGRDPDAYPDARKVDFDRKVVRHLSFGAGPHRCLGSHLARQELTVLLQEWHRRIPEYEVVGQPTEHGGQVWGLDTLQLSWT